MASSVMLHPQTNIAGKWYASQSAESSKTVVTSGKGMLHTLVLSSANAAVQWVYVFDSAAASGTVIAGPISVPATGSASIHFPFGIPFGTALTVAISSTQNTFTAGGSDLRMLVGWATRAQLMDR